MIETTQAVNSNITEMNVLISFCTVFRRLFIMYGLLSLLMLFLGIDAIASSTSNTIYTKTLLGLYILQAISYMVVSVFLYPLGQWINILSFTKAQIMIAFVINLSAVILIIIRTAIDLSYCAKYKNADSNDDEYANNQNIDTAIAWIVISFLLIMLFNGITLRFLLIFYSKLDHFQEISRNHPTLTHQSLVSSIVERPTVTQAYVSNSPFAHHDQTIQGKVISVSEPGQINSSSSPMAVPVNNTNLTISSVTAHNL